MIRLQAVAKRYGARPVLRDLTLHVAPGEVVALVGPNGAGKSTALKALVGLVRPDSGSARINGFDLTTEPEEARALVGYAPQRLAFPDHVTPLDLLRLVAALRGIPEADAMVALESVALGDRLLSRTRELSGGQRQRLSLALALAGHPRALVLDEPSISLDAEAAATVCAAVARARQHGAAVLFASHHFHEVRALADRVVFMHDGRCIAEAGTPALRDLSALEDFYREALRHDVTDAA